MNSWIGVDLDGTLAEYDAWRGSSYIGPPIKKMVDRVKKWIAEGKEVRIFTARVSQPDYPEHIIHDWLQKQGLPKLKVTNEKDYGMIELWDDRCVQVIENTGERADGLD